MPYGRFRDPNYGVGEATIEDDDVLDTGLSVQDEEQRLKVWLDGFLDRKDLDLPRPPRVAMEILALSQKPSARIEDIASLLEREPLLAGRVLKLANSALYGSTTPVTTLKMALVRMGLATVRDVVMEAAFHLTVIRAEGFTDTLEQIRRHSTAAAWLSRFVARNTSIDAEHAFLVGLLHDVGLSVGLVALTEFCRREKTTPLLTPRRWAAVDAVHQMFTERVLHAWGLPPGVQLVARHHHSLVVAGRPHPNIAILLIAERIAYESGWGVTPVLHRELADLNEPFPDNGPTRDLVEEALKAVNLSRTHYEMFVNDTKRVLQTLAAQFKEK